MDKDRKNEIIVGIFTSAALLVFVGLIFMLNNASCDRIERTYTARFLYVDTLEEKAPVTYAGCKIGQVERVVVTRDTEPVLVTFTLTGDIPLRRDVIATIETTGFIGQKYIALMKVSDTETELGEQDVIDGVEPLMMSSVFTLIHRRGDEISTQLRAMLDGVNSILTDQAVQTDLRQVIAHASAATAHADELLVASRDVLNENRGDLRTTMRNAAELSRELKKTAADIDAAANALRSLSEHADGMTQENRENLAKIIANFTATSENIKAFSADIEANPWKLLRTP